MILSFDLPEYLLRVVTDEANRLDTSPNNVLMFHLTAGMDINYGARAVVLQGADLSALEARLGGGTIASSEDLVKKVERLARIEFGGHEIRLSPAELEEIAWRARKQGKTVADVVKATWAQMNELFFSYAQRS